MANWIYLKKTDSSFDEIKAAALASVLCLTSEIYNIVHTNVVSIYMRSLKNVIIGNPSKEDGDVVIEISLPDYAPFQILCKKISKALNINSQNTYRPYLGFVRKENEIDRQLSNKGDIILFCYYQNEDVSLIPQLENVVCRLKEMSYNSICCGSKKETLIKGAFDFRGLIQIDEIIKNKDRIKVIITSTQLVKEIGCLLGIPVAYLYSHSIIVYYKEKRLVENTIENGMDKLTDIILDICNKYR